VKTRSRKTSSRNELWTPRGGFEPPSSAGLYFESSVLTFISRQENVVELRSPFQFYRYVYMLVNRAELNFPFFFPKLIKYKTSFRFKESPRTFFITHSSWSGKLFLRHWDGRGFDCLLAHNQSSLKR